MTELEFDNQFDNGDLDDKYSEYIMENCGGERAIGNGDMLIEAMESFYLYDSFKEAVLNGRINVNA